MGIFNEFSDCTLHPPRSPMKGNAKGKPIHLGKSRLHSILILRKSTNNLGSLGSHPQDDYPPSDKRGNIGLSSP